MVSIMLLGGRKQSVGDEVRHWKGACTRWEEVKAMEATSASSPLDVSSRKMETHAAPMHERALFPRCWEM